MRVQVVYCDGDFREQCHDFWDTLPRKAVTTLLVEWPPPHWIEVPRHDLYAAWRAPSMILGHPIQMLMLDRRGNRLVGERWRCYPGRPPVRDRVAVPVRAIGRTLPSWDSFIPGAVRVE